MTNSYQPCRQYKNERLLMSQAMGLLLPFSESKNRTFLAVMDRTCYMLEVFFSEVLKTVNNFAIYMSDMKGFAFRQRLLNP